MTYSCPWDLCSLRKRIWNILITLWIPCWKWTLSAITPTCWNMICNSCPYKWTDCFPKIERGWQCNKRPLSKDNTSWTVNYLTHYHYHVSFLSFPFSFKPARKLSTTPWKAQDTPATIRGIWIATFPFPFPWERTCESSFKSSTSIAIVGAAGKWLEII